MYDTEKSFSKYIMTKLKKEGFDPYRLESHLTSVGFPDIFCQGYGYDMYLELKNSTQHIYDEEFKVPWRPGQQAWYNNFHVYHYHCQRVLTLMSVAEGIVVIHNDIIYDDNKVPAYKTYRFNNAELRNMKLGNFLLAASRVKPAGSYRIMMLQFVRYLYGEDFDWDPEVVWNELNMSGIDIDSEPDEQKMMDRLYDVYSNL